MGADSGFDHGSSPVTLSLSEKTEVEAFNTDDGQLVSVLITQPYSLAVQMIMSRVVAERWRIALAGCLRGEP